MRKGNQPETGIIDSEHSDADCAAFGELYVCNDCGSHDVGIKDSLEAFCHSCSSLNIIVE